MSADIPIQDRIFQLLEHLGIEKAHFGGRVPRDWEAFLSAYPEKVVSLSLICPRRAESPPLAALASRLLVVAGEGNREAETLREGLGVPDARVVTLPGYQTDTASDIAADRTEEVANGMLEFLARNTQGQDIPPVSLPEGEGEVAGLIYRVQGSGPPLVLLPMQYSPSQWDSLLPRLSQSYCTITLGGPNLGAIFSLEARAKGGYLEPVRRLVAELQLQSGEKIMDVGCGPGSIDRWLAHHTGQANPIVGVDPGSYLLREARAMAQSEGLAEVLTFQEGGGENLPFPDNSFDVAMSLTAIQYVDADRMLREMRRLLGWEAE